MCAMRTLQPLLLLLLALASPLLAASPQDDTALHEEVQSFFDQLTKGIEERDTELISTCLDFDHLADEMETLGVDMPPGFMLGLRMGLIAGFTGGDFDHLTERLELRSVEPESDGTTRVIIRVMDPDLEVWTILRWWLVRGEDARWRTYDWMDLDLGLRASTLMAAAVHDSSGDLLQFIEVMQQFDAALVADDYTSAQRLIEQLGELEVPDSLKAVYWVQRAALETLLEEYESALVGLDRAQALSDTTPLVHILRATVLSALERYPEALASAERYQAILGTDADTDASVGFLLIELDREEEAFPVLLRALEDNPGSLDALGELMRLHGNGHDEELLRRLAAFPDVRGWFDALAGYLLEVEALAALRFCCAQLDALAPEDTNVEYYLAEAEAAEENFRAAAQILVGVLPDVPAGEREIYLGNILTYGGVWDDDPVWAYAQVPDDAHFAFDYLAWEIDAGEEGDEPFEALAARHAADHPRDYRPAFHRGRRTCLRGDYGTSEEHFAKAMQLASADEDLDTVLEMRVENLIRAGKVSAAYTLEPTERAWEWILDSCYWSEDAEALLAGVELRRADHPNDAELGAWQGYAHWLRGEEEQAAELLGKADLFATRLEESGYTWALQEAMLRAMVRTGRAKEARGFLVKPGVDPFHVLLLRAHLGNARRTASAVEACLELGWEPEELLQDEDLGPALADPEVIERLGWQ